MERIYVFGLEMEGDKRKMDTFGFIYKFLTKDSNYYNLLIIYIIGIFINIFMMFNLYHADT